VDIADLALEWDENVALRRGHVPSTEPILFIVNRGSSTWEDDGGQYWAFVQSFDVQTGRKVPASPVAIGGVGLSYRLGPGERVRVPAAFSPALDELPAGEYEFEAVISELSLRSERRRIPLA
jgi:hypothetical protein